MTVFQEKACDLIERLPEQKVKLIFALLFETALNSNEWDSDMEYFQSIPGYVESLTAGAQTPLEECVDDPTYLSGLRTTKDCQNNTNVDAL